MVLKNSDGISVPLLLEWIEKFAFVFKPSVQDCLINMESGEQQALENMKLAESNVQFQNFVDCLLAVDETDINTAFAELDIDRSYSLNDRKQKTDHMIKNRSNLASMIAFVPVYSLIFGYLVAPTLLMVSKMYQEIQGFLK
jgi:hypothetical protein